MLGVYREVYREENDGTRMDWEMSSLQEEQEQWQLSTIFLVVFIINFNC